MSNAIEKPVLLEGAEFTEALFAAIHDCYKSFTVCSAFIKRNALEDERFSDFLDTKSVHVVARWQKHDLMMGASDLSVYEYCKQRGWKFGIDTNLHGKLFLIDEKEIFLGSANLTQRGLHIGIAGNLEFGTRIPASKVDIARINQFVSSEVTWLTDELYHHLVRELKVCDENKKSISEQKWSIEVSALVQKPVKYLWMQELIFKTPVELLQPNFDDDHVLHDFDLLGMNVDSINEQALKINFRKLRLFNWLYSILKQERSIRFGSLTAALHSAILDDPKPYRIDIKKYNQIIFAWAEFLSDDFETSQPNHSQVISLKETSY